MSDPSSPPDLDLDLDRARVELALGRLPRLEREALLLKARHGLSYADIGALLGLSAAAAEARVASALVELHAELRRPQLLTRLLRIWRGLRGRRPG